MLFKNIKNTIMILAKNAVLVAEEELGSGKGQAKKQMAIEYIVSHLPFTGLFKTFIAAFLSRFIDDAVEIAVEYMHKVKGE